MLAHVSNGLQVLHGIWVETYAAQRRFTGLIVGADYDSHHTQSRNLFFEIPDEKPPNSLRLSIRSNNNWVQFKHLAGVTRLTGYPANHASCFDRDSTDPIIGKRLPDFLDGTFFSECRPPAGLLETCQQHSGDFRRTLSSKILYCDRFQQSPLRYWRENINDSRLPVSAVRLITEPGWISAALEANDPNQNSAPAKIPVVQGTPQSLL